jgi:IclR family acetate operon transcriptional repressor
MAVKRSRSASRVLAVLDAVAAHQPVGVSALAKLLDADKSATQRALMTLADDGWIRPLPRAQWELTPRLLAMSRLPHSLQDLRRRARAVLGSLRDAIGETAFLIAPDTDRFVIVEAMESDQWLRMVPPLGMIVPVRGSATGRAVLAFCDAERQAELLGGAPDPGLCAELAIVRTRGHAISEGEIDPGSVSFAAPVFDGDGTPIGAIVLSGPRLRITPDRDARIGALVAEAAARLSTAGPSAARS